LKQMERMPNKMLFLRIGFTFTVFLFFILISLQSVSGQLTPNDPCIDFYSAYGDIQVSFNDPSFCWRIRPLLSTATQQPRQILLQFSEFIFYGDYALWVYGSQLPASSTFIGEYWGNLSSGGIPPNMTITAGKVLFIAQGQTSSMTTLEGGRSFNVYYEVLQPTEINTSLNLLIAVLVFFAIPLFCVSSTKLPCYAYHAEVGKKDKFAMALFFLGFGIGSLFFILILARDIQL